MKQRGAGRSPSRGMSVRDPWNMQEQLESVNNLSMDMWPTHINVTLQCVPGACEKVAFDRFHVSKHLGDGIDKVLRQENRALSTARIDILKGTGYDWLTSLADMSRTRQIHFKRLRASDIEDGSSVGDPTNGNEAMALRQSRLSTQGLEALAGLGDAVSSPSEEKGRPNSQEPRMAHIQSPPLPGEHWARGEHQQTAQCYQTAQ